MIDFSIIIITLGGFLAAFINAAFATGGVYVLLASGSAVFPMTIAIPLMPLFAFSSLVARIFFFWKDIAWRLVIPVFIGSSVGVYLGVNTFIIIPEALLSLIIGCLLLLLIWAGSFKLQGGVSKTLSFLNFSDPTRLRPNSYAFSCLKKKNTTHRLCSAVLIHFMF